MQGHAKKYCVEHGIFFFGVEHGIFCWLEPLLNRLMEMKDFWVDGGYCWDVIGFEFMEWPLRFG